MKVPMKKKIVLNYNDFGRINERLNHCFMYKFITCLIFHQYLRYFKSIKIFFLRINNFKINKKATRKMSKDVVLMLLLLTLLNTFIEYFLSSDLFNICKKDDGFSILKVNNYSRSAIDLSRIANIDLGMI